MAFQNGDPIQFRDPLGEGALVNGTFIEIDVGNPVEVPLPGGGTRMADVAWVSREDRTTARVPFKDILRPTQ